MTVIASARPLAPWCEALLGLIYPNACQICHAERATPREGYICSSCRTRPGAIQWIQRPFCERCGLPFTGDITNSFECTNCRDLEFAFETARAAVAARGLVLDVIHRYKYSRALWFEPFLAELLLRQAIPVLQGGGWDKIVPVPLHPVKRREREFNQAERLARRLGRALHLPVETGLIERVKATATQTLLSRSERAANMARAFQMGHGRHVEGQRLVLVDDVFTTGATCHACAKVLRHNGAGAICVWTVARGL